MTAVFRIFVINKSGIETAKKLFYSWDKDNVNRLGYDLGFNYFKDKCCEFIRIDQCDILENGKAVDNQILLCSPNFQKKIDMYGIEKYSKILFNVLKSMKIPFTEEKIYWYFIIDKESSFVGIKHSAQVKFIKEHKEFDHLTRKLLKLHDDKLYQLGYDCTEKKDLLDQRLKNFNNIIMFIFSGKSNMVMSHLQSRNDVYYFKDCNKFIVRSNSNNENAYQYIFVFESFHGSRGYLFDTLSEGKFFSIKKIIFVRYNDIETVSGREEIQEDKITLMKEQIGKEEKEESIEKRLNEFINSNVVIVDSEENLCACFGNQKDDSFKAFKSVIHQYFDVSTKEDIGYSQKHKKLRDEKLRQKGEIINRIKNLDKMIAREDFSGFIENKELDKSILDDIEELKKKKEFSTDVTLFSNENNAIVIPERMNQLMILRNNEFTLEERKEELTSISNYYKNLPLRELKMKHGRIGINFFPFLENQELTIKNTHFIKCVDHKLSYWVITYIIKGIEEEDVFLYWDDSLPTEKIYMSSLYCINVYLAFERKREEKMIDSDAKEKECYIRLNYYTQNLRFPQRQNKNEIKTKEEVEALLADPEKARELLQKLNIDDMM